MTVPIAIARPHVPNASGIVAGNPTARALANISNGIGTDKISPPIAAARIQSCGWRTIVQNQSCHLSALQPISIAQNSMRWPSGIAPVPNPPVTVISAAAAAQAIHMIGKPGNFAREVARFTKRRAAFAKPRLPLEGVARNRTDRIAGMADQGCHAPGGTTNGDCTMLKLITCGLAALGAFALVPVAQAQPTDTAAIAAQKEAMKKLDWMHGVWRGQAVTQSPQGQHKVTQTERIGSFLGGTLTVMEGKGYTADGSAGFNAFGVISYDAQTKSYWLTSWALGRGGKFALTPTDTGYIWEIPAGATTIRYTATVANGSWTEVGDYIAPGQPARRFLTMTLRRVGDSDWPAAGGIAKD